MATTLTPLGCSECADGTYRATTDPDTFLCPCGYAVHRSDVERYLDANETLSARHNNTSAADIVIVRTDACECCGSISDAHFSVWTGDGTYGMSTCPNDTDN